MDFSTKGLQRLWRNAGVAARLAAANVVVFVLIFLVEIAGKLGGFSTAWLQPALSLPSSLAGVQTHPWTLLTYMFTQFSAWHLIFNCLWLYWFGQILQLTMRERYVCYLYIAGGLAGAVAYLIASALNAAHFATYLCGSSASVLAVMTAAAMRSPNYSMRLFLIGTVKLKWIAVVCIALALLGVGGASSNLGGQAAHVGGIALGLAFGLALRKGRDIFKPISNWQDGRKGSRKPKVNPRKAAKAFGNVRSDMERLDELLGKIKLSGYESLSRKEKNELDELSNRLSR